MKKFLAVILSIMMVLSIVPMGFSAFATEPTNIALIDDTKEADRNRVIASAEAAGTWGYNLFDGNKTDNNSDKWWSGGASSGYIILDLGAEYDITNMYAIAMNSAARIHTYDVYTISDLGGIEYKADNKDAIAAKLRTGTKIATNKSHAGELTYSAVGTGRYVMIDVTSCVSNDANRIPQAIAMSEVEIYGIPHISNDDTSNDNTSSDTSSDSTSSDNTSSDNTSSDDTPSAPPTDESLFEYTVENGEASITGFDSNYAGEVVIPSSLGGYPVTSIGDYAFYSCSSLTSITIPDSVTSIGDCAFEHCDSLESITIPEGVTSIGYEAFYDCSSLISITIPEGVTSIGSSAFVGCSSLTSITIPNSVTSIGSYAFEDCSSLTSVTIPDSVTSIGSSAFYWCDSLTSITIPDSVTSIGGSAFDGCSSLTSITIPDSVTSIDGSAFDGCDSLTDVYITDIAKWCQISFSSYHSNPLYCADNLYLNGSIVTDLVIPDGVTSIGKYAFYGCDSLTSITIPEGVTSIGYRAFNYCSSLTSINLGKSVTSIGDYAFYCSSLKTVYYRGSKDDKAKISMVPDNRLTGATWYYNVCDTHTYSNNSDVDCNICGLLRNVAEYSHLSYTIKNGVPTITGCVYSFSGELVIPSSFGAIDSSAFYGCSKITSIIIPSNIKTIGNSAFVGCTGLKTVKYRGSETEKASISIDYGNTYLTNATWVYNYCTEGTNHTFNNACDTDCNFCSERRVAPHKYDGICDADCNLCDNTRTAPHDFDNGCDAECNNCGFTRIVEHDYLTYYDAKCDVCGDAREITDFSYLYFDVVNGQAIIISYDDYPYSGGDILIPSMLRGYPVTQISGSYKYNSYGGAFAESGNITSITIPNSVTNISKNAFYGCSSLTNVYYSGSEEDRANMFIDSGNDDLIAATWHYNSCIGAAEHVVDDACYDVECNLCHQEITPLHVYTNNCDFDCNECGYIREVGDHDYDNACDADCNVCGAERVALNHKFDNNCDAVCNECGEEREVSDHDYKENVTKATLTKNGKIVNKCEACGKVESTTTVYYPKTFSLSKTSYTYNGKAQKPTVTVKDSKGKTISSSNYTVKYSSDCKNAGTYTVTVTMKGNYSGTKKLTYKINPIDVSKCKISLSKTSYTYNGKVQKPSVTVKSPSGAKLTSSSYTVKYSSDCKNAGTYTVTVTMKGNYSGTKKLTYKINPLKISSYKLSATSYTYNGKTKTPSVTVKNASGTKLTKNTHFTVTYSSGRKNVGTYKVTIKGKGNYTGTKTLTYKINPAKISSYKLSDSSYVYTGKAISPSVIVKNSGGKTLKKNTDYTVTYSSGRKNPGAYTVTIKGKGNYTGTKKLTFKIYPVKTTVSKLSGGKKQITVNITKKTTQVTGYQIEYSTSKSFSNAKKITISSNKTTKYTLKNLSAKKTYYVRVRTYKKVGNTLYCSGWSTYKSVKTK